MPKCKHNYTVGIRIPWTLASEENWNRTHRFAGPVIYSLLIYRRTNPEPNDTP
ncbi:MAG TPA: hypothetical protein DCG32_07825 [Sphaerochaeta sp.]|nr:hypothetical protein [Sphaerochaeta sp.]